MTSIGDLMNGKPWFSKTLIKSHSPRPYGISHDVQAFILDEERSVPDPGNGGFVPVAMQILKIRRQVRNAVGIILLLLTTFVAPLLELFKCFIRADVIDIVIANFGMPPSSITLYFTPY